MNRTLRILLGAVVAGASVASAAYPYTPLPGKYNMIPAWDSRLTNVWTGWKRNFLVNGITQGNDPAGNKRPISEGQSYAMLMAVWMGDQATFNTVWAATETDFWTGQWYRWKSKNDAQPDNNFAGDADIDICGALIFASALVDDGKWTNHTYGGNTYKAKAVIVLKSIIANFIDKSNNYRINSWPGAGDGIRNPSYHMPGWYPILKEFGDKNGVTGMDWDAAAKGAFDLLEVQTNASKGMARNFSNGSGGAPGGGTSSPNNYDMGFDAIRVPYRVGIAGIWYPKKFPRAISYAKKVWAAGAVDPQQPGMYSVSDAKLWGWGTNPQYEEYMSRAMWGTLATAVNDSSEAGTKAFQTISSYMQGNHVKNGIGYLAGAETDSTCATCPARNYYGQSLGLMGALAMAGRAPNIWDDLKNPWTPPDTTLKLTGALTATPATIQLNATGAAASAANTTTITASLSRPAPCTLFFVGRTSGGKLTKPFPNTTTSISYQWNSNLKNAIGSPAFVAEIVDVRFSAAGISASAANAKTTITLSPSTSIQPRKATLAPIVSGGVVLTDRLWNSGDQVRVRVMDLAGRELQHSAMSTLEEATNGVVVSLTLPRSLNVRLLEVSDPSGSRFSHYLISPNP